MHCSNYLNRLEKTKRRRDPIANNYEAGKQCSKKIFYTRFVITVIVRAKSNVFINQLNLIKMRKTRNEIQSTKYIILRMINMILAFEHGH